MTTPTVTIVSYYSNPSQIPTVPKNLKTTDFSEVEGLDDEDLECEDKECPECEGLGRIPHECDCKFCVETDEECQKCDGNGVI